MGKRGNGEISQTVNQSDSQSVWKSTSARTKGGTGAWKREVLFVLLTLSCISGCNASLPEPESPAAQLYQKRCSICHRLYAPRLLTSEMWQFMMGRMEMEMQRRSVPLPPPAERATILEYLQKHASNAAG